MDSPPFTDQPVLDSEENGRLTIGKENMVGRAIYKGMEMLCPVSTDSALAIAEQPELRAYKLGKQKCSYNQVELAIRDIGAGKVADLKVSEAIETCAGSEVDEKLRESCLKFNVRFMNNNRMHLYIYVVYATPYGSVRNDRHPALYHWIPVTRSKCRKGCKGPVIRGLQRFGRMPRRNANTLDGEDSWKEPRHLYIAIDEASTHVCPRHETSKFRLLVAAYDDKGHLLGTTVSSSIRVLANNDAPLGAAAFKLHCHIKGGWGSTPPDFPLCNNVFGHATERNPLIRPPLQDILHNSSPPGIFKSTTTDETAKLGDITSTVGPFHRQERNVVRNEKQGNGHELLNADKSRHSAAEESILCPKAEKDHSLTDLCHRLFRLCATKYDNGQATITLRSLANCLGARRRRILEILNVLESIHVVEHQGKERYMWVGSRQIAGALVKMQAPDATIREKMGAKRTLLSPIRRGKLRMPLPQFIDDIKSEADSPMRALSKRFIRLFLAHEKGWSVSLENIIESIIDGKGHDPETIRAKTRRLSEIARIFSALHLIRKTNQRLQSGLAYEWLGVEGVKEHLANINSTPQDKRPNRKNELNSASSTKKMRGRSTTDHQEVIKLPEECRSAAMRGQNCHDHGRLLDHKSDAKEQSHAWKDTVIPDLRISQGNVGGEAYSTPVVGRRPKRRFADKEGNEPSKEAVFIQDQQSGHGLYSRSSDPSKTGSSSNCFLPSCGGTVANPSYRLCQPEFASGHVRGGALPQPASVVSGSKPLSKYPIRRTQRPSSARIDDQCRMPAQQEPNIDLCSFTTAPELASKRDIVPHDLENFNSPCSSDRGDQGETSLDKTDEGSTTTERQKVVELKQLQLETPGEDVLPTVEGSGNLCYRDTLDCFKLGPQNIDSEKQDVGTTDPYSSSVVEEESANIQEQPAVNGMAKVQDRTSDLAGDAAHQFPYKKRRFDATTFANFAESNELHRRREFTSPPLSEQNDNDRGGDLTNPAYHPSGFDPLFYLLRLYSPQRILELQLQNPAFLFTYVKEARALYHQQCVQSSSHTLIRPVAQVRQVSIPPSVRAEGFPSISPSICGHRQPSTFLSASR